MLIDRINSGMGKAVSWFLILTTQSMVAQLTYAQDEMSNAVLEANQFSKSLLEQRQTPNFNNNGEMMVDGQPLFNKKTLTGQKENDYVPAGTEGYGSDSKTLRDAQTAINKYEEKDLDTAETSGERAYHILKKSFATQKPDLSNDPIWENTDNVYDNLEEISQGFAECKLETKDVLVGGNNYHVPKYKTCERLPAIEDNFTIAHDYDVGVIKYNSGPVNINKCGDGCIKVWVGTVGDNYWDGWCDIFEESMTLEVLQPKKITYAVLERSKFDDYHQVWIGDTKVYNGPNAEFPPEVGTRCELSTSWDVNPNINLTNEFRGVGPESILRFKTRTSVAGSGEGYSVIRINYDNDELVYNDVWETQEDIAKALQIHKQANDGFCEASITCADMPTLDENGCTTENGIKVCESNFKNNPFEEVGLSPFCRKVQVSSDCGFNEGQFCTENLEGKTECIDNDTVNRNTCTKYEEDSTCSFVKSECVDGAEGDSGTCYVQEDTYDCGFTASTGETVTEDVLTCDGQVQCIGESCYSPTRDTPNEDFAKANAYLEMLRYAQSDMKCEGVPERPFDPESPPDRYTPVPSCASGYEYSKEADMCLKATQCAYSESDFYAAGQRNGIQAVTGGFIVINDSQISTCVPVEKNGQIYTCGEAQKKVATDTFYSICQNERGPKVPNGCPDPAHELNSNTGYCEVPPSGSCPAGYEFQEGGDPFSKLDDLCIAPPVNTEGKCPTGSLLVGDQCVTEGTYNPQNTCPSGYQLSNGKCNKTTTANVSYSCGSGYTLSGSQCVRSESQCRYNSSTYKTQWLNSSNQHNYYWNGKYLGSIGGNDTNWKTFGSEQYKRGAQKGIILVQPPQPYPQFYVYEICKKVDTKINATKKCPSGYSLSGNQCKKTTTINATPVCTNGGKLSSDKTKCEYSSYVAFNPTCPSGYKLNADKSLCYKDPTTVPVEDYLCPAEFPVWNDKEQRCTSKSLSPLAKNDLVPSSTESSFETAKTKQILDEVLQPFEFMLNTVVPNAYASEQALTPDGQPTSEEMTTKKSMMEYISGQFDSLAETQAKDIEMVAQGQKQLRTMLTSRSATANSSSAVAYSAGSSSNAGESNVTCELFKGEAAECKIAVGGMKNCCESPVAVSLGDYIKLTQRMIQMDGMTGEIFGLDGYAGVWDTAADWGADAAATAWDTVQGAFSTGADVAANAAADTAADVATDTIMDQVAQQIMSYTNQFLIDTFGPEVAGMFFQTVATSTGGTAIAGSAAMQAAGAALMVVYYAYLAYVVFNLLVDIAFACEEEELDLGMKIELLSVHKIGSYCASEVLGACIEKRNVYCKFDSPLSRIVMEEVYKQPQMGLSWGTAKDPNCSGIAIDKINEIDWDKVNLDEWTGILIETDNFKANMNVDIDSLTGSGSVLNYTPDGRQDVLERNKERFENIDLDEVKRDAYEDGWNKLQPNTTPN